MASSSAWPSLCGVSVLWWAIVVRIGWGHDPFFTLIAQLGCTQAVQTLSLR